LEYKVLIGGTKYGMTDISSAVIESPLFDSFSAGNACSREIEIEFWPKSDPPRMAEIVPYARNSEADDWVQLGVFFTDERSIYAGKMKITGYDSMLKAEAVWKPEQTDTFPMYMKTAAEKIASVIGVSLDPRCAFEPEEQVGTGVLGSPIVKDTDYYVNHPGTEVTMRDVLRYIAAAHAANWIITRENKLLLVPLFNDAALLVDESGNAITFGEEGARIVV
jgi:hypothetical protein